MTILRSAILLGLSLATVSANPTPWKWQKDGNRSVKLSGPAGPVARFLVDPAPADPHFDLLATADGRNLVWVHPPDHSWHYGHWFSWKMINGVNFWETDRKTGVGAGQAKVLKPSIKIGESSATVRYRREYRLRADAEPVMKDQFTITIRPPEKPGFGPQIDWTITTTALADVILDRTPLPDEPGGKPHGGYGGLSWRGAKGLSDVRFLDSKGRIGMDIHRKHARWADARGTLADKAAGIAIFDHPGNPGHPTSWFLVATEEQPFWYLNPALLQPKPLRLKKGESFTHRYRVLVHDGSPDARALDREAKEFASS
jgi:hypothetical protein